MDPPDGRLPPWTPEGQRKADLRAAEPLIAPQIDELERKKKAAMVGDELDAFLGAVAFQQVKSDPVIGPAVLNPATCSISSSHGTVNSATQAFRNNPNGYRPLYAAAETQIHNAALRDRELLTAGEQSTRTMLTQVLETVGVKKVTVDFS